MEYYGGQLRRSQKAVSRRRYSAGYGDFSLENQQLMYERLHLKEIGVKITDTFILVPEKSVTAIAGIQHGSMHM